MSVRANLIVAGPEQAKGRGQSHDDGILGTRRPELYEEDNERSIVNLDARLRVLVADTNRAAAHSSRMVMGFSELGCEVAAICTRNGHPIRNLNCIGTIYSYNGFRPLESLRSAINDFLPDLIVPACDSSVGHLHRVYAGAVRSGDRELARRIEHSLGSPASFSTGRSRYELISIAREEGILVPETFEVTCKADLDRFDQSGRRWALKQDGSTGGEGVWCVTNRAEAEVGIAYAWRKKLLRWVLKRLDLVGDLGLIVDEFRQPLPRLLLQEWIDGRPANCAMACWEGEILAGNCVEVLESEGERGHATLVELVEGASMFDAARRIARRLRLSGFFGLDFIIEHATGRHYLLEMNPRCSALSALRLRDGHDLPAALRARILGVSAAPPTPVTENRRIAYFPRPACDGIDQRSYHDFYYDVPQGQPELTKRLQETWPKFSLLRAAKDFIHLTLGTGNRRTIHVWVPPHEQPEILDDFDSSGNEKEEPVWGER